MYSSKVEISQTDSINMIHGKYSLFVNLGFPCYFELVNINKNIFDVLQTA